jgi:DNA-binding LytR/AlgR family response regulator
MMKVSCLIIDDEPLARKGLKEYINDVPFLELAGEFDEPMKATALLSEGKVQLLFLDIQMPKITGLHFFKSLIHAPPVIFTTAYPQYALDGFDLNALDYLVKPISFDRFFKACLKAKEYYEVRQKNTAISTSPAIAIDHFFVKADTKLVKIFFDEILFVEALQNYINIYTGDKKYITYLTFRSIEEYLPSDRFIKIHKSYIISIAKVDSIEGSEVRIGMHHVPISRNLKDDVMSRLLDNRFLKR